ncbi:MAG: cyanoexosortase A [Microcoleaceae cyanobacterium]
MISVLIRDTKFWLLSTTAGLTAIYFTLMWFADDTGHLVMSALFFGCAAILLWEKRHSLSIKQNRVSVILGLVLIGWMLRHSSLETIEYLVRLFPAVLALGMGLVASGWYGLKQYWQELLLLFCLSVPSTVAYYLIDISPLTAQASSLLLWYSGFDVSLNGVVLSLPDGQPIRVVYECSGIDMVLYMFGLSVICLVMFPIKGAGKVIFSLVAIAVGFLLNSVRIAMLVVLFGVDQDAFNKWHTGTGSYTFAMIGVIILGIIYWVLLKLDANPRQSELAQFPEINSEPDLY